MFSNYGYFLEGPEGDVPLPYPLCLKSLQILGIYQQLKTNVNNFLFFLVFKHDNMLSSAKSHWAVVGYSRLHPPLIIDCMVQDTYLSNLCILLNNLSNSQ